MKFHSILLVISLLMSIQATHADIASDAEQVFSGGQYIYPQYFPSNKNTQTLAPWLYRFYSDTGIYLAHVQSFFAQKTPNCQF